VHFLPNIQNASSWNGVNKQRSYELYIPIPEKLDSDKIDESLKNIFKMIIIICIL
jgi:hypothetical protein